MTGHAGPAGEPLSGVILAGGKSSRFGSDKASAPLLGRPMLQWVVAALAEACDALVIVAAKGQELPRIESRVSIRVVRDRYPETGPLGGLTTGFAAVITTFCFATSCDAPLMRPELVRMLVGLAGGNDVVCPLVNGRLQPLAAVYRPAVCLPVFETCINAGRLKLAAALDPLRTHIVPEEAVARVDPGLESFINANRPAVIGEIERRLRARHEPILGETP